MLSFVCITHCCSQSIALLFTAMPSSLADFLALNGNNITGVIPNSILSSIYDLTTTPSFSVSLKFNLVSNPPQSVMIWPLDAVF